MSKCTWLANWGAGNGRRTLGWVGMVAALAMLLATGCSKQGKVEKHLRKGDEYFRAEAYNKASIEYLNVLRLDRANRAALLKLGAVYLGEGDNLPAWWYSGRAVALDTNDVAARVQFGKTLDALGNWHDAREMALFALAKQPTNGVAMMLLVDSLPASNVSTNEMYEVLNRLLALQPGGAKLPEYHLALGNLYVRLRDLNKADAAFRAAIALDPRNGVAHWGLGAVSAVANDFKQAEATWKNALEFLPAHAPERLKYANFKLVRGEVAEGRKFLEDLTAKAPDFITAQLRLAELALGEKRYAECENLLGRMLAQSPNNYNAILLNVQLARLKGQPAKAVADLEKLAANELYSRSPIVRYQLAMAQLQNTNRLEAVKNLRAAVDLDTNYFDAVFLLSDLYAAGGEASSAIRLLSNLSNRPDLQKLPYIHKQAVLRLARVFQSQRDYKSVESVCAAFAQAYPTDPDAWFSLGESRASLKNTKGAREAFEKAAALAPANARLLGQVVQMDMADKKTNAALKRVEGAVEQNPKSADLLSLLAAVLMDSGQPAQAEAALKKALQFEPNATGPYMNLARLYNSIHQPKDAVATLQSLLDKYPKEVSAITNLNTEAVNVYVSTLMLVAGIQESVKDYAACRAAYEQILEVMPRYYPAMNNLAYLWAENLGDLAKGLAYARQTRQLNPNDASSGDTLGWILYRQNAYAEALPLIQESAEKLPENPEIHYHLGMLYSMVGNEDGARNELREALSLLKDPTVRKGFLNPEGPAWQKEAQERLNFLAADANAGANLKPAELEERLARQPNDLILVNRLGAAYEKAGAWPKAIELYQKTLSANPKTAETLVTRLASAYEKSGDLPRAEELIERVAKIGAPAAKELSVRLVTAYEKAGAPQKAAAVCERLIAAGADSVETRLTLVRLYADKLGDNKKAFEHARIARNLAPQDATVSTIAARLAYRIGDAKWAASLLSDTLRLAPNQPDVQLDLALAQYAIGQVSEAVANAEAAARAGAAFPRLAEAKQFAAFATLYANPAKLAAANADIQSALKTNANYLPALMANGVLLETSGDAASAARAYDIILGLYPQFLPATRSLGILLAGAAQTESRALELLNPIRNQNPKDAPVAKAMGMVYLNRKDAAKAVSLLKDASAGLPADPMVFFHLGQACQLNRDAAEAQKAMQTAIQLGLKDPWLQEARKLAPAKK
jgi:tetratricopeptide (TPR) repeat protein